MQPWRTPTRPEQVVRRTDVRHPVAERLVDRVLQRAAAGLDRRDLGAEQAHAKDVQGLTLDVLGAHVDLALETEERGRGGRGHAVLTGAGLRDEPALLHARGEEPLPQHVVDLVGAGVTEILALEIDARAADVLGKVTGEVERRGPSR